MRGEDFIVPKLGSGPQRHKYNIEQLLATYVSLSESGGLVKELELVSYADQLPDDSTRHQLLTLLEGIASQMVGNFMLNLTLKSSIERQMTRNLQPSDTSSNLVLPQESSFVETLLSKGFRALAQAEQMSASSPRIPQAMTKLDRSADLHQRQL